MAYKKGNAMHIILSHSLPLGLRVVVMQTVFPPLHVSLDHRDRRQDAEASNHPSNDFNDFNLMAQTQATLNLTLELIKAARYARVGAFNIPPHLVNQNPRHNPQNSRYDKEDLGQCQLM